MLTPTGAVNLSVPDTRLMSRVYGGLLGGGGLLALGLLAVPGLETPYRGVLLVCAVASVATGGLLNSAFGRRLDVRGFYALSIGAVALITVCFWLAGVERPGFVMFYLWVCPWAFVFFSRRWAAIQLALTVSAFSTALCLHYTSGRGAALGVGRMVSLWLIAVGTLTMVSLIVRWLAVMTRGSARWLSAAFMQSTVGLVVIALDGKIVSANPAFAALVGRDPKDVEGGSFLALLDPDDRADCEARLRDAAHSRAPRGDVTKRFRRRGGSTVTVSIRPTLVIDEQRTQPLIFAQVRDVSLLEQSEMRARAATALAERRAGQQEALAQLGRAALTMPARPDLCQRAAELVRMTLAVPTAAVHQLEHVPSGYALTAVASSPPDAEPRLIPLPRRAAEAGHGSALGAVADALTATVQLEGRRWGFLSCGRPTGSAAEADAFLRAVADVLGGALTRDRYQTTLAHSTLHDQLTGLPNRALLLDRVDQALARIGQHERHVCLLVADVDSFKHVNDSHGHAVGDAVLLALAGRLAGLTRPGVTLARLGSDEFAICFEMAGSEQDVLALPEQVRQLFAEPVTAGIGDIYLTTSIGVAVAGPGDIGGAAELLRKADTAVHRAKEAGRNRIETYDGFICDQAAARMRLVGELHRAIGTEQLSVVYQPAYSLTDGRMTSLEALLRFDHPDRGPVSPAEFIPIAEETGLIVALGDWVLREAVRQRAEWTAFLPPEVRVCVNVSPRQLTRAEFADEVETILAEKNLPATCIGIEVTETALAHDMNAAASCIRSLKQAGITVLLDDFGTGYSSLSQLQSFAVDVIKLDRSFVAGVTGSAADGAIAKAVIAMAHALGLTVTAEGVETEEQSRVLRDMGCDDVQGFFHSRPLQAEQVAQAAERAAAASRPVGAASGSRGEL